MPAQADFLIIGHRGARAVYPENTEAGFAYLVENGIHWAETDLRVNAAGDIVLMHDPHLPDFTRVLDGEHPGLARLTAILERFPTLHLNLEIKSIGAMERLVHLPALHDQPDRFILSSFLHPVVRTLKELFPKVPCLFVMSGAMLGAAAYVRRHGVDGLVFEYEFFEEHEIRALLDDGRMVLAFTVNRAADARAFRDMGLTGIITDDPVRIRAELMADS